MCSVRQRPIPTAPKLRATSASCGVSALVRTFIRIFIGQKIGCGKITGQVRLLCFHFSFITLRLVPFRDEVTFFQVHTVNFTSTVSYSRHSMLRTGYAALTHTTEPQRQRAMSYRHVRSGYLRQRPYPPNLPEKFLIRTITTRLPAVPFGSIIGKNTICQRPRRSRKTAVKNLRLLQRRLVEYRVKQFVQLVGSATQQRRLSSIIPLTANPFIFTIAAPERRVRLREPELTFLHGEPISCISL